MITLAEPREHDVVLGGGSPNNVELEQGRAAVGCWLAPLLVGAGLSPMPSR